MQQTQIFALDNGSKTWHNNQGNLAALKTGILTIRGVIFDRTTTAAT